jgi:hypothetical protein
MLTGGVGVGVGLAVAARSGGSGRSDGPAPVPRVDDAIGTVRWTVNPDLPAGWAWAEPGTIFPDEPQVPPNLRGKPVPNLVDAVLVATSDPTQVGTRVEGTLAAQTLLVENLTFPPVVPAQIEPTRGNIEDPEFKGGLIAYGKVNDNYRRVQNRTLASNCYGGQLDYARAIYMHHPEGTKLKGSLPAVKPPTHVKLRAIVRIR